MANMLMLSITLLVVATGGVALVATSLTALLIPAIVSSGIAAVFVAATTVGVPDASCFLSGFLTVFGAVGIAAGLGGLGIASEVGFIVAIYGALGLTVGPPSIGDCLFGD